MATDLTPTPLPDSRPLHRLIAQTRRLLRSGWVATGVGITLGLLLGSLTLFALLDLFLPIEPITLPYFDVVVPVDPFLRCVALVLIVVPTCLAFIHGILRPLFRRLRPTQVARRIEQQLPGIHNRLVSAIDLEDANRARQVSPVFLHRLLTEALERIKSFRPASLLDLASLRRAALAAGLALAASTVVWGLFSDRLPTALARIFFPLADIPPASGVAYAVEPGSADVLRNEDITFTARVTEGDPESLRVDLVGKAGNRPLRYELRPDRNDATVWRAVVDGASLGEGFQEGFTYRVYGGRTWSKQHRLGLVDRPVIVGVSTAVYFPKYMKIPEAHPTPPQAVAVAGPEGSEVEVVVSSQKEVAAGDIQLLEPTLQPIPVERQQERAWFEEKLPTGATLGGSWEWTQREGRRVHTSPASVGTYGHWFEGDPVGLVVGKGDVFFAHVFIPAGQSPRTLMLEWHDGDGWEHRAFWGDDLIREGKPGTVSRQRMGALPAEGRWVRLEVPAAKVGLENRTVRGLAFKLHGGQVLWGRAGLVQVEEPGFRVVASAPLARSTPDQWVGRFPLVGAGLFRAELRNAQGHPSKPMKELRYLALPDNPPYVTLKRNGNETILASPAPLPLSIGAFDDYGVDEIRVVVRDGSTSEPRVRTLWSAGQSPKLNVNLEGQLTESAKLASGGALRYLIEVRDTKGQTARTPEYVVRLAADAAAADQQLTTFDKVQDSFTDRLVKLLAEQKKVKSRLDELTKEHAKLSEKLEASKETPPEQEGVKPPEATKPAEKEKAPKLTPEEMKRLEEVQKELAKLAAAEEANATAAEQLNADLKRTTEEATKLDSLPQALADQMSATQKMFERAVAGAMRDLAKDLKSDATPKTGTPNLPDLKGKSDRIDRDLEGVKDRLDALSKARKGLKEDLEATLRELGNRMAVADAKRAAADLENLKEFLEKFREQMKQARGRQDEAAEAAGKTNDLPGEMKKQEDIDKNIEKLLAQAKKLLDKGDKNEKGDDPEFPDAPFRADEKDRKVPPREQDSDEPLPNKKKEKDGEKQTDGKANDKGKDDAEEDDKKFMPRLGGPREKVDPRYAGKQRPMEKKPRDGKTDGDEKQELANRQNENSKNLDAAEKSVASDEKTLADLLNQLNAASSKGTPQPDKAEGKNQPNELDALADQLRQMMQSRSMREAMAMAAAAAAQSERGQQPSPNKGQPNRPALPIARDTGNLQGGEPPGGSAGNLAKLDPATRAMILKLPPSRYREELIRGLNEQGPEAYRGFIQDYFRKLTESKPGK